MSTKCSLKFLNIALDMKGCPCCVCNLYSDICVQTCIEPCREQPLPVNELCQGFSGFLLRHLLSMPGMGGGRNISLLSGIASPAMNLMCPSATSRSDFIADYLKLCKQNAYLSGLDSGDLCMQDRAFLL